MKYCHHCGTQLEDNTKFCSRCGKSTSEEARASAQAKPTENIVNVLSERLKLNGIIWIVIGCFQIILGLCGTIVPLIVGVLNIISAVNDLKASKNILVNPRGIVAAYEPITMPIISLVYNLVFGGIIGVAGSIFHLIGIRQYVVEHKDEFLALENS